MKDERVLWGAKKERTKVAEKKAASLETDKDRLLNELGNANAKRSFSIADYRAMRQRHDKIFEDMKKLQTRLHTMYENARRFTTELNTLFTTTVTKSEQELQNIGTTPNATNTTNAAVKEPIPDPNPSDKDGQLGGYSSSAAGAQ